MRHGGITRRDFTRLAGLAAMAGVTLGLPRKAASAGVDGLTFGVQLFMVRRQAQVDLAGVLRAIRQIGYTQVELYPIAYTHPARELRRMVEDAGLGAVAGHFDYVGLEGRLDYAKELGLKFFVCPMLPHDAWSSLAGFRTAAALFNRVGEGARARGMEFVFHNHDYEFRPIEGSRGFDMLMKETDPHLVKLEFDLYWLTQGGQDPAAMLARYRDRARLIHLKDRTAGAATSYDMDKPSEHFTELGKGTIDWRGLLEQAQRQGIRYAFVDQDETAGPVLESLHQSWAYLQTLR